MGMERRLKEQTQENFAMEQNWGKVGDRETSRLTSIFLSYLVVLQRCEIHEAEPYEEEEDQLGHTVST